MSLLSRGALPRLLAACALAFSAVVLCGCAATQADSRQRQVASLLAFLYPAQTTVPAQPDRATELRVPFRIGIAFVPQTGSPQQQLSEVDRQRLMSAVRSAFVNYPFVSEIETVPTMYLEAGGGFANLDRVAQLLRLDVIALVAYDQVQNADASGWSFLYWTGIGAYVVEGDRYDVLTSVEAAVFDVRSRRLLLRAAGSSRETGSATLIGFAEKSRAARVSGFDHAMAQLIESLRAEVQAFRERAPKDPGVHLVLPAGYDPALKR
jgi:rhombotail lipoprotein